MSGQGQIDAQNTVAGSCSLNAGTALHSEEQKGLHELLISSVLGSASPVAQAGLKLAR